MEYRQPSGTVVENINLHYHSVFISFWMHTRICTGECIARTGICRTQYGFIHHINCHKYVIKKTKKKRKESSALPSSLIVHSTSFALPSTRRNVKRNRFFFAFCCSFVLRSGLSKQHTLQQVCVCARERLARTSSDMLLVLLLCIKQRFSVSESARIMHVH